MSYKQLKEEKPQDNPQDNPQPKTSNGVAYAEMVSTLIMTAMFCGTLLMTTSMWIQERQVEVSYLRGSNP